MSLMTTIHSLPESCDLHFALSHYLKAPLAKAAESQCCDKALRNNKCSQKSEKAFFQKISGRARWISKLFKQHDNNEGDPLKVGMADAKTIAAQVSKFLDEFEAYRAKNTLNFRIAQTVYAFAQDMKRHESLRKEVWTILPEEHQTLLHRLTPWTEDLNALSRPIFRQWLGNGDLNIARQEDRTLTDFGNGRLFEVEPPLKKDEETRFQLVNHPDYYLVRTSSDRMPFYSSALLTPEMMGRMGEVFDVQTLESKIEKEDDSALARNQLMTLFNCYRAALCSVFDLSVAMPAAIGKLGEWTIWPTSKLSLKRNVPFSQAQLTTLHRFFVIEKLWNINVLGDHYGRFIPHWATSHAGLLQEGTLPLPSFLREDIGARHEEMLNRFQLDQQARNTWNKLEREIQLDIDELNVRLQDLQALVDEKKLSEEDLQTPSPRVLQQIGLAHDPFKGRLLCLRLAAALPDVDPEKIDQLLQSALHDEMTRQAALSFLGDFQKACIM